MYREAGFVVGCRNEDGETGKVMGGMDIQGEINGSWKRGWYVFAEREGNVLDLQYIGYQILGGLGGLRSRIWRMAKNVGDFVTVKVGNLICYRELKC